MPLSSPLAASLLTARGVSAQDSLYITYLYTDPAAGETAGPGSAVVYHAGIGKPVDGPFLEHAPGEVAEYHLFVPEGLEPGRTYPLWIVYHGGRDGE